MMSPPMGARGGEAGEVDGGGAGIDIPGCMMSPPLGAKGRKRVRSTAVVPGLTSRAV